MKKTLILLALLSLLIGCQREKANEIGVGYNKSLIIPPTIIIKINNHFGYPLVECTCLFE